MFRQPDDAATIMSHKNEWILISLCSWRRARTISEHWEKLSTAKQNFPVLLECLSMQKYVGYKTSHAAKVCIKKQFATSVTNCKICTWSWTDATRSQRKGTWIIAEIIDLWPSESFTGLRRRGQATRMLFNWHIWRWILWSVCVDLCNKMSSMDASNPHAVVINQWKKAEHPKCHKLTTLR